MKMTWALVNLKPGVGKSTTGVYLGQAFHELNYNPLLVDADAGRSSIAAYNRAGGLSWPVVPMAEDNLHTRIPQIDEGKDVVLIDVPQVEDHARIARGALRYAETWVLPIAPSVWEIDRMFEAPKGAKDNSGKSRLLEFLEEVQDMRSTPADVVVSLNRTNRAKKTKTGPDADVRDLLTSRGFHVLDTVIPFNDDLFRQAIEPRIHGTNMRSLALELLARRKAVFGG